MPKKYDQLITNCEALIEAYNTGGMGNCALPEDEMPIFAPDEQEAKLAYFTLPTALNYRRSSTQLWEAALATYEDPATQGVFSITCSAHFSQEELRRQLLRYGVAMQPNRHTLTWSTIAQTIDENWGTLIRLLESTAYDFLLLKDTVQRTHRKGFPYLAGPKLFNYWSFILGAKCDVELKNKEFIDIAVDSHVLKCSTKLGVITVEEANTLTTEKIAERWRDRLTGSSIAPTDLNVPLWFWSRNGFAFEL